MLSKLALSSSKGGARHKPAPVVDPLILAALFGKYKASICDFGIYEHISVNQAVKGNGLVAHYDFLKAMLTLCPSGDMPGTSAKTALLTVICQAPDMNTTIYNTAVWAGMRCERLGCLLNHVRRLAREPDRLKQAAMSMTGAELSKLKGLMAMIQIGSDTSLANGLASGVCSDDDATVDEHTVAKPKKRLLVKTASDASQISVDSQGFPSILESCFTSVAKPMGPGPSAMKKSKTNKIDQDVELDEDGYPMLLMPKSGTLVAKSPKKAAVPPVATDTIDKTWVKMWYKGGCSVGIRRGRGHDDKAQIFSISNRSWSQKKLEDLGDECLRRLHAGEDEQAVCEWSRTKLGK